MVLYIPTVGHSFRLQTATESLRVAAHQEQKETLVGYVLTGLFVQLVSNPWCCQAEDWSRQWEIPAASQWFPTNGSGARSRDVWQSFQQSFLLSPDKGSPVQWAEELLTNENNEEDQIPGGSRLSLLFLPSVHPQTCKGKKLGWN